MYSGNDITSQPTRFVCVYACFCHILLFAGFCIRMHDTPEVDISVDVFDATTTDAVIVVACHCTKCMQQHSACNALNSFNRADNLSLHLQRFVFDLCQPLVQQFPTIQSGN